MSANTNHRPDSTFKSRALIKFGLGLACSLDHRRECLWAAVAHAGGDGFHGGTFGAKSQAVKMTQLSSPRREALSGTFAELARKCPSAHRSAFGPAVETGIQTRVSEQSLADPPEPPVGGKRYYKRRALSTKVRRREV